MVEPTEDELKQILEAEKKHQAAVDKGAGCILTILQFILRLLVAFAFSIVATSTLFTGIERYEAGLIRPAATMVATAVTLYLLAAFTLFVKERN